MVVEMATTMRVMSSHVAVQRRFSLLISSRNFLSRNIDTLPVQGRNLRFVISYGVTKHHIMYIKGCNSCKGHGYSGCRRFGMHDTFISVQSVGFFASVVVVALNYELPS
jgi:hypothetical protein